MTNEKRDRAMIPEEHGKKAGSKKMFEQDANDIPEKVQPQVPNVSPPSVQPGHRDREQI